MVEKLTNVLLVATIEIGGREVDIKQIGRKEEEEVVIEEEKAGIAEQEVVIEEEKAGIAEQEVGIEEEKAGIAAIDKDGRKVEIEQIGRKEEGKGIGGEVRENETG